MSRARDFADLAGSADAGGLTGRNMVINTAMQVSQPEVRPAQICTLLDIIQRTMEGFSLIFGNEDELRVTMCRNSVAA